MKKKVSVIDYGIGNLFSISNAVKNCNADAVFCNTEAQILSADRLILPGVGGFKEGMQSLNNLKLVSALKQYACYERPLLGICLGMQLMLTTSEEFGISTGLDIIPGTVKAIPCFDKYGKQQKIPHIGWNSIQNSKTHSDWNGTILKDIPEKSSLYFVHSYAAKPINNEHSIADTCYGGWCFSSVIAKGFLYGTQFHPEKSGNNGLKIIRNFLEL